MDISIIVPIYKGKKYIAPMVNQIEKCQKKIENKNIELIFINDYPEEKIKDVKSQYINIKVVNLDKNVGIHGARIKGFEHSVGEYVLFLDQDDKISDDYFFSQLLVLDQETGDAVICRAKENNCSIYTKKNIFETTIDENHMFTEGNSIVSPGQVLIKRTAVPKAWLSNQLIHNGADDWLLWLCMLAQKSILRLNYNDLFEHIVDGSNASWNSIEMIKSEYEVYDILESEHICDSYLLSGMRELVESEAFRYINILEKYRYNFALYDKWLSNECKNGTISLFLKQKGYNRIAIYGFGVVGKQLYNKLLSEQLVTVVGLIDQNAEYISGNYPVTSLADFNQKVDIVIISLADITGDIATNIKGKIEAAIVTLEKILDLWRVYE